MIPYIFGLEIAGLESFDIDFGSIAQGIMGFVLVLLAFVAIGILAFVVVWKRKQAKLFIERIFWFQEVNGQIIPIGDDWARQLTIPNSGITVFYIKSKNMYLPVPTKRMGKNAYWYVVKNNRELVNFTMKNINEEKNEGGLDYDHTDMRYAQSNLKDLIKRNYIDKATPWWKEYKELISWVILIFIMSISFYFLFTKMAELVDRIGSLINIAEQLIRASEATSGSGIIAQ